MRSFDVTQSSASRFIAYDNETNQNEAIQYSIKRSKLEGSVKVSGAKNSVLRLLAASLLSCENLELDNYPASLRDAQVHLGMLEALGKRCEVNDDHCVIYEEQKISSHLEWKGRSIRNTLLILGALTARTGAGSVPLPGGCKLGDRKYDLHVMLLEKLGARVFESETHLKAEAENGLIGADIVLPMRSTGATENAILCGTLAKGKTTIWGPHIRPEIIDLIDMLNKMGANILVFGQERIEIEGVATLSETRHRVIPDNMEALTWMIGATLTGGDIEIQDFPFNHLDIPLTFLRESGTEYYIKDSSVIVRGGTCYPVEISTGPYPGINSDMQPLFAIYGALANGESRIIDLRFPGRYVYAEQLAKMGVKFEVEDNLLKIHGGTPLAGSTVKATDLRAGIALTLAGCVADGETILEDAWQVERGYDRFVEKIKNLNGNVHII